MADPQQFQQQQFQQQQFQQQQFQQQQFQQQQFQQQQQPVLGGGGAEIYNDDELYEQPTAPPAPAAAPAAMPAQASYGTQQHGPQQHHMAQAWASNQVDEYADDNKYDDNSMSSLASKQAPPFAGGVPEAAPPYPGVVSQQQQPAPALQQQPYPQPLYPQQPAPVLQQQPPVQQGYVGAQPGAGFVSQQQQPAPALQQQPYSPLPHPQQPARVLQQQPARVLQQQPPVQQGYVGAQPGSAPRSVVMVGGAVRVAGVNGGPPGVRSRLTEKVLAAKLKTACLCGFCSPCYLNTDDLEDLLGCEFVGACLFCRDETRCNIFEQSCKSTCCKSPHDGALCGPGTFTVYKYVNQCCCFIDACALPCDDEVPLMCGCCGAMCIDKSQPDTYKTFDNGGVPGQSNKAAEAAAKHKYKMDLLAEGRRKTMKKLDSVKLKTGCCCYFCSPFFCEASESLLGCEFISGCLCMRTRAVCTPFEHSFSQTCFKSPVDDTKCGPESFTLCKFINQCCCLIEACAIPCDDEVPMTLGLCGVMCIDKSKPAAQQQHGGGDDKLLTA